MTYHPPHPPEKREQAKKLREQGKSYRQISEQLGVGLYTIGRWLDEKQRQANLAATRRYKHRHKKQCVECGKPVWLTSTLCATCSAQKRRVHTKQTVIQAIQRFHRQHGRPPTATEWVRGAPDWPNTGSVTQIFGSWANAIEQAGYPRPRRGHKLLDHSADRAKAKQLHAQGTTIEQLADLFNLPPSTIRGYLQSTDRTITPTAAPPTKRKKRTRQQRIDDLRKALQQPHNQ